MAGGNLRIAGPHMLESQNGYLNRLAAKEAEQRASVEG